jgi:hypothetical protein
MEFSFFQIQVIGCTSAIYPLPEECAILSERPGEIKTVPGQRLFWNSLQAWMKYRVA